MGNPWCDGNVILKPFPVIPVPLNMFYRLDYAPCLGEIIDVKGSFLDTRQICEYRKHIKKALTTNEFKYCIFMHIDSRNSS